MPRKSGSLVLLAALLLAGCAGGPVPVSTATGGVTPSNLCLKALSQSQSDWDSGPDFREAVSEAQRRGYTVESCRQAIADAPAATQYMPRFFSVATVMPSRVYVSKASGRDAIVLTGRVVLGSDTEFMRVAATLDRPLVFLVSEGGLLGPGLNIGRIIRARGWETVVPEGWVCYSSCALAWLAGSTRYLGAGAQVGFHAGYRIDARGQRIESAEANALVGMYLSALGLPDRAAQYVAQTPPTGMKILTPADAAALGIAVSAPRPGTTLPSP